MPGGKVKVEIYEGDPFKGCCGPGVGSIDAVNRLRTMLMERNDTVKKLKEEFKEEIEIEREIVSARKGLGSYPERARRLLLEGTALPFVLINGQVAIVGTFPSFEQFRLLIGKYLTQGKVKKEGVV